MIVTLSGLVAEKLIDMVVIEAKGVGYGVHMASGDWGVLNVGDQTRVYVYESIRETSFDLFGFTNKVDKVFFELLLSVNGVGPKMAMAIMNVGSSGGVRTAIATGDTKYLQGASGVGKRVAERIVVDLKDKVGLVSTEGATDFLKGANSQDEAVQALMALGFSIQDASLALKGVDNSLTTEERIKLALKGQA